MIIKKSAVKQYVLIYLMMLFNGGVLYPVLEADMPTSLMIITYAIVGYGIAVFFIKKREYENWYCMVISIFLLLSIIFVRYTVGGVGINSLMEYLVCIMVAMLAACVDRELFVTRIINLVYAIAEISVVCYLFQINSPEWLKMIFKPFASTFGYNDWSSAAYGGNVVRASYMAWGKLFFSMRDGEMSRNLGIFTEPGNYQIVLNSALFLLMFLPELYTFSPKQLKRRFFAIVVALLTCQSTSGYLIFFIFCITFFVSRKQYENMSGVRRIITLLVFLALGALVVDYNIRENDSLLNTAVLSKLFDNGSVDVTISTGYWRLGTTGTSIMLMIMHPLGNGFNTTFSTIQNQLAGSAGGALMAFGAALGIIPFIATVIWFVRPIFKDSRFDIPVKIAYLVMYIQISLAQSKVFYPFLVAIIVVVVMTHENGQSDQVETAL